MALVNMNFAGDSSAGTIQIIDITNGNTTFSSRSRNSINVASKLPNDYMNLTLDNFSLTPGATTPGYAGSQVTSDSNLFLSYDQSTGILSTGIRCNRATMGTETFYVHINYYVRVTYISSQSQ